MTQAAMDNDTMVAELLPCPSPWCNHRAYVASTDDDAFYGKAFQGRCTQCGLGGPVKRTEAEAIAAWNARQAHSLPGDVGMREAAKTFLAKLDECTPYINDAFIHRELRCGEYTGPTYAAELENLRQALKDTPTHLTR